VINRPFIIDIQKMDKLRMIDVNVVHSYLHIERWALTTTVMSVRRLTNQLRYWSMTSC